ncbi:MAG: DEAD/DEAH box helicase family protein [Alphaproteobacteria bacterium]
MQKSKRLLSYLQKAVNQLLDKGRFDNGRDFRPTQREALTAYKNYLAREDLGTAQKLKGYFEIPTGVGKTALFVGIATEAYRAAAKNGHQMRTIIVEPRINLLEQTGDAFGYYAPEFKDQFGYYGDGYKDLTKPITIMTYNAWSKLSAQKKISAQNVDLLISDEGHRGTSEGRVETLTAIFKGATGQLAFTATAHFDKTKSVRNSHEREIFYKSLRDCWRDKEVSEYYAVQYYEIRVDPSEIKEARKDPSFKILPKEELNRRVKQAAWNRCMLKILCEGRDEQTNDLLSDNVSGFFTDDINHARNVEKMLNGDPVLQERAKESGRKTVAIALHSLMSPGEKRDRFKAIENGECMVAVGDGMFKEGYDYAPMRNVFDYPRSSLVDKAQIIGRAGRKWRNPVKDRWEGTNIVDTIIYIGSDDPEEDKRLRKTAVRRARLAEDVTEGTLVLPAKKREKQNESATKGGRSLFKDDPNVKAYTTTESRRILIGEREKIREGLEDGYAWVTPDQFRIMRKEAERTNLEGAGIRNRIKNPPKGLTRSIAGNIVSGVTKSAPKGYIDLILRTYAKQPTSKMEPISAANAKKIKKEAERTGMGGKALFKLIKNPPEGMDSGKLKSIISGAYKSALPMWVNIILKTYSKLPTKRIESITATTARKFKDEEKRTGLGGTALFKLIKNPPEGMDSGKVAAIVSGKYTNAIDKWIELILKTYSQQPDKKNKPISAAQKQKMSAEEKRTGLGGVAIFSRIKNPPEGMSAAITASIVSGRHDSTTEGWVALILDTYKKYEKTSFKLISPQIAKKLKAEEKRTGLGGAGIFQQIESPPEGLNAGKVASIVAGRQGSAPESWVNLILYAYEKNEPVSKKTIDKLQTERMRTGIDGKELFRQISNPPRGLTRFAASKIISGRYLIAPKEYISEIFKAYASLPSKKTYTPALEPA